MHIESVHIVFIYIYRQYMSDIQSQVYCIVKRRPHDSEATKQSTSQIQKCCSANVHHPVCDAQDNQESRFMK